MKGFIIDKDQSLPDNIRGILHDQIEIITRFCVQEEQVHVAIYEIRRNLKRIRAILRLIRDDVGYSAYYRENIFYRDLGKAFSDIRDLEVLIRSVELLELKFPNETERINTHAVKNLFRTQRDAHLHDLLKESDLFSELTSELESAGKRIDNLVFETGDFSGLRPGLRRNYKQGRKFSKVIRKDYSIEAIHNLRKRSKYLLFHIELLKSAYPKLLKAYARSLEKFTGYLGDYRDFTQLEQYLMSNKSKELSRSVNKVLLNLIKIEKTRLLANIISKSGLIYAEKPGPFVSRLELYWNMQLKNQSHERKKSKKV